jgi:hypothetical protein
MQKEIRLPEYDGSYDAERFCEMVQKAAQHNQWDEAVTCLNLVNCLKGPTRQILSYFAPSVALTSKMLLDALKVKFGLQLRKEEASTKLRVKVQAQGETLRQLGMEIEMLVNHAYPLAEPTTKDDIATSDFVRAISDGELRKLVALERPRSLREAMRTAEEIESTLRNVNHQGVPTIAVSTQEMALRDQVKELWQELKELKGVCATVAPSSLRQEKQEQWTTNQGRWSETKMKCYRCGEPGHLSRNCFARRNPSNSEEYEVQGKGQPRVAGRGGWRKN